MERGRGENRQLILVGAELFRFPGVWEGFGVELGFAKHLLDLGVEKGAVDGLVGSVLGWGGGMSGQWGGVRGGTGWGWVAQCLGLGGGLTLCRGMLFEGRGGCGASSGGCGASGEGCGCHVMRKVM